MYIFSILYWQISGHLAFSMTVLEKFYALKQIPSLGICHMNTMTDSESVHSNIYTFGCTNSECAICIYYDKF